MNINEQPRVVSIFSGAGCFDIGFEAAGFRNVFATDLDQDCCETLSVNLNTNVVHAPIDSISYNLIRSITSIRVREIELLIGGPPCQPFSKSANGAVGGSPLGFKDDRAKTVQEYMRIVEELLPKAFVIENVPQFITGKNLKMRDYLQRKISRINKLKKTNYKLTYTRINSAWFGVPQLRDRIFIIGNREGKCFKFPEVRFFNGGDKELGLLPYRSAWDAIGNKEEKIARAESYVGGKWGKLLKSIPPGQNYLWHTSRGGGKEIFEWRARYWNFLLKLHPMLPSWTIAANPGQHTGPFHWNNRRLTTYELQKLQTIPDDYIFCGSATSVRRQIGNGVPSAIGELIGKEIRRQFFGERISSKSLKLIPDVRPISYSIKRLAQAYPEFLLKETASPQASL